MALGSRSTDRSIHPSFSSFLCLTFHAFMCLFVHSYVHSFIRSLDIRSSFRSFVQFIRLFVLSCVRALSYKVLCFLSMWHSFPIIDLHSFLPSFLSPFVCLAFFFFFVRWSCFSEHDWNAPSSNPHFSPISFASYFASSTLNLGARGTSRARCRGVVQVLSSAPAKHLAPRVSIGNLQQISFISFVIIIN